MQHAQGAMQGDTTGTGDLQALFDTSALVLGVALVVPDPQVLTCRNLMYISIPLRVHANNVAQLR
jgi:hypothetical protein